MPSPFTTFALEPEDIAVVFPLVHAAVADIDLPRWRSFARRLVDLSAASACGAIGVRSAAGYVCGVLTYRVEHDLRHGKVLAVDLFAALDLLNEERAVQALILAAETKSRELNCAATCTRVGATQKLLAERFATAVQRHEATLFLKTVGPSPVAN